MLGTMKGGTMKTIIGGVRAAPCGRMMSLLIALACAATAYGHVTNQDRARTELRPLRQKLINAMGNGSAGSAASSFSPDIQVFRVGAGVQKGGEAAERFLQDVQPPALPGEQGRASVLIENLEIAKDGLTGAFSGRRASDLRGWTANVAKNQKTGEWMIESFVLKDDEPTPTGVPSQIGWVVALAALFAIGATLGYRWWRRGAPGAAIPKSTSYPKPL